MAVDPVCKMTVDEQRAAASVKLGWKTYYFTGEDCRLEFLKDPEKYLRTRPRA